MAAATADRNTARRDGTVFEFPVKAATKIFAGTMVVIDTANNLAIPGKTATGLKSVGVCQALTDNSAGADGDIRARLFRGPESLFRFANSAAGDLIVLGDIGADCYLVDDSTVAKTSGSATRSVAGKIRDVDSGGVWVEF
ncbi:hypothetical protein [Undibacterium sp. Xuan67W]|uniref:hypothetical protein n=1 Tax=Undibacterium sp. Xuan67W TaxID=3413057 RepID=UPI003BF05C0A